MLIAPGSRPDGLVPASDGRIYLHPGQLAVTEGPCTITTILGSCVAVALHDPVRRIGGLNHFLLPKAPRGEFSTRYGEEAMRRLLSEMRNRGATTKNLRATVIGGACVLHAYLGGKAPLGLGNVKIAIDSLELAGVSVLLRDVGGNRGRRVNFHPDTGDVVVRVL